jgi:hypothetical protein
MWALAPEGSVHQRLKPHLVDVNRIGADESHADSKLYPRGCNETLCHPKAWLTPSLAAH